MAIFGRKKVYFLILEWSAEARLDRRLLRNWRIIQLWNALYIDKGIQINDIDELAKRHRYP